MNRNHFRFLIKNISPSFEYICSKANRMNISMMPDFAQIQASSLKIHKLSQLCETSLF
jgi:hypothetical protein